MRTEVLVDVILEKLPNFSISFISLSKGEVYLKSNIMSTKSK